MKAIKEALLKGLTDITTVFDYNNENTQYLSLKSVCKEYELIVDVTCFTKESVIEGNYHSDKNDFEGSGKVYDIYDIEIKEFEMFKNREKKHLMITFYELSETIRKHYE